MEPTPPHVDETSPVTARRRTFRSATYPRSPSPPVGTLDERIPEINDRLYENPRPLQEHDPYTIGCCRSKTRPLVESVGQARDHRSSAQLTVTGMPAYDRAPVPSRLAAVAQVQSVPGGVGVTSAAPTPAPPGASRSGPQHTGSPLALYCMFAFGSKTASPRTAPPSRRRVPAPIRESPSPRYRVHRATARRSSRGSSRTPCRTPSPERRCSTGRDSPPRRPQPGRT